MKSTHGAWLGLALALVALSACDDESLLGAADAGQEVEDASDERDSGEPDVSEVLDISEDGEADVPEVDPTVIRLRYEPEGDGFYRVPWPSDGRLTAEGTPSLDDYPGRDVFVDRFLDEISRSVPGYSTMPVIYVGLEDPVDEASLPEPLATLESDSPVQLIELGEQGCGQRVPVNVSQRAEGERFTDTHTLEVKNTIGTVLKPGVPYAVVVLESLGAQEGKRTPRPAGFDAALAGEVPGLSSSLSPLLDCLAEADLLLPEIAAATVFTPHDPVADLKVLRDFVMSPDNLETRPVQEWEVSDAWSRVGINLTTFEGFVELPIFQEGVSPYISEGGRLVFDDAGQPVVQRWEQVEIAVSMRDFEEPFEGPRPVLVFIDGTGWSPWTHLYDSWIVRALNNGYVIFSVMPQFHGDRPGSGSGTELYSFNFLNPSAGRSGFRQQAAEVSYFVRLIREQLDGQPGLPELDVARPVYGGHSQGALVGSLVASVETEYAAYAFNGLAAYLTLTMLYRQDIIDFNFAFRSAFMLESLDIFEPMVHLFQLGADVVDPHNYASRWRGWEGNPAGNHVFVSNGLKDTTTTKRGMDHLTISANLPIIEPPGWEVDEENIWDDAESLKLPIEGNTTNFNGDPLTIATFLDGDAGHFTIYQRSHVRQLAVNFWNTALDAEDGVPALDINFEYQCDDGHDEDGDGLIDCDDPQCDDNVPCNEVICDDGEDDDGDGLIDCQDETCQGSDKCREVACDDGEDNNFDGLTDCEDPDCARIAPCGEQRCGDGEDGDNDGLTDCDDDECARSSFCVERNCVDGEDSDNDGLTDCEDPDCVSSNVCPELDCTNGEDDDANNLIDCEDFGCAGTEACPIVTEEVCDDGEDDDGDEATDCEDSDCALDPACNDPEVGCPDFELGAVVGAPVFVGDLTGASNDIPPGDCVGLGRGADSPDVSLLWTAPATGDYLITTANSEIDTVLSVYRPTCGRRDELGCNDDWGSLEASALSLNIAEGNSVVIVVSGYGEEDAGPIQLHISGPR